MLGSNRHQNRASTKRRRHLKWVLVYILVESLNPNVTKIGVYDSMATCFEARESVLVDLEAYEGIPPVNTQLVCVKTDET